tara:strand:+ start:8154 stop:9014 length:861 start_codon:yes stop_codon:yes gene_type:complete
MATKRWIPLNKIEGVVAGGTAIIDLPTNVRYHGIALQYDTSTAGGATEVNMEAEATEIRCNLEQVTQRKASAAQTFDINRTKKVDPLVGDGTKPGFIPLLFSEPQRETQIEQEATAWGMQGVTDFQIEVDIAAGAASPQLKGFAYVDDVQEAPRGIVKWKRNTLTVGQTGETPFSLSTTGGDSYQGLHFFEQVAGDINSILLEWDGVKMNQLTEYQNAAMIDFLKAYKVVSGNVHIPLDGNHPADALRTIKEINGKRIPVQELIATLNMAASNNVTLIREMVGLPD